jgi:2-C-methyl-D-erythritol 2,4-cyclodiphosphate synthase
MKMVGEHGFKIVHLDVIIHAEKPKLKEHKPAIRAKLAEMLGVTSDQVNVKAKTNEGMDAVGENRAIAAWAVATVTGI